MYIQINADKNLNVRDTFAKKLKTFISEKLQRFDENLTRLDVHFSDINGRKAGVMDKQCAIEARLNGKPPLAARALGDNYELALKGAIEKLMASLERITGKMKN